MNERLSIVNIYPDLLGTYGDCGNALALAHRAAARGIPVDILDITGEQAVPGHGDIYLIGGGEDSAQLLAARALSGQKVARRVLGCKPCLAVCAGLQLLAQTFGGPDGRVHAGLGILDITCARLDRRAVGEVVANPLDLDGVPTVTGFENHQGTASLGPSARPLGRLVTGTGNGDGRHEGAVQGLALATYLHGPVLVRNPALADLLLARVVADLAPHHDADVEQLRLERLDTRRHRIRHPFSGR